MSQLTITPHDKWQSVRCSIDCVCQNGAWLVPCTDPACDIPVGYLIGKHAPNYPVPAIRYEVAILPKGIAIVNRTEKTIDCVVTKLHHIIYNH